MARQTRSATSRALSVALAATPASSTISTASTPVPDQASASATLAPSKPSDSIPQLLFPTSEAWVSWLSSNHHDPTGLWLQIAKKSSPTPSVTYDQALDAALCYGWIDGQRRPLDANYFLQRFTPRRKRSIWSRRNVDKVAALSAAGLMKPPGEVEVERAKADGRWEKAYGGSSVMEVPADFAAALATNVEAERFFATLSKGNRYRFLWRIETVKKTETRKRKIGEFVRLLAEGKTL
ncbi:bacteriocin-protection, YdeI or OmpD-associated-domain-containing protein [Plectosphaerella plurivora]|uniref:Bacteriocin-protection, YdeI or OmpD-associated-domain-containing protein n=1 Tax=Plectosphaerella plurivora TaxID=936078 RepID=A0A9P8VE09_9PEZI|nr:bacteriocin-protection, YdeI or OmpD-associated-domain-containing protein [Plectosphaerella plurivora]